MPAVLIPALLRDLTGGRQEVHVPGSTLREVLDNLDAVCPGLRERICDGSEIKPGLSLAVDGETAELGLLEPVSETSEVQILPALAGGESRLPPFTLPGAGEPTGAA